MKEWLLSVTVVIILSIIILLILPDGRLYGLIKSVFCAVALITILSPIIDFSVFSNPIDFVFGENEQAYQEDYLDYVFQTKIDDIKTNCKKIIEKHKGEIYFESGDLGFEKDFKTVFRIDIPLF